jgi:hypothetical protein
MIVCGACLRSVAVVAATNTGSMNHRGTVRRPIMHSLDAAEQVIMLRSGMTTLMIAVMHITTHKPTTDPETATGTLMESCIMPRMDRAGSIWRGRR